MLGLMDHALRAELLALGDEALSGDVHGGEARRDRALEHAVQTAHRETAFRGLLDLFADPLDLRIDRHEPGLIDVEDGDAQRHADLRCGDPDPARRDHRGEHPAGKRLELRAAETGLLRGHMKHRVTDLSDVDRVLGDEFRRRPLEAPTRIDAPRRTLAGTQTRRWRRPFLGLLAHPSSVTGSTSTLHSAPAGAPPGQARGAP